MPTYEFECKNEKCRNIEEIFLKHIITDTEKIRNCESCNSEMELIIFSPNWKINDQDHGWYIQDPGFNNEKPEYNFHIKQRKINNY